MTEGAMFLLVLLHIFRRCRVGGSSAVSTTARTAWQRWKILACDGEFRVVNTGITAGTSATGTPVATGTSRFDAGFLVNRWARTMSSNRAASALSTITTFDAAFS